MKATHFLQLLSLTSSVCAQTVEISGTSAMLGDSNHVLTCTLMGSGATDLEYQWSIGERILQPFSGDSTYLFGTVFVSDAQNYTCEVRGTGIGSTHFTTAGLHVTIDSFVMTFNCENSASINPPIPYVGSNFTYCCRSLLTSNLRETYADLMGSAEIIGPSGTPIDNTEGRVRVSEVMQIEHNFEQILSLSPLSDDDKGKYTCNGTLLPVTPNSLITNGIGSTTQQVFFPELRFEVELLSMTGRVYSDIDLLSLTCSATVMVRNDPAPLNMEFTWLRSVDSGPREELTSDLYTNSMVFGYNETSTLTVFTEWPGNHIYYCRVNLNVMPAPDIMIEEDSVSLEVIGLQFEVELAPVPGRFLNIEPYNSLSLTCSATLTLLDDPAPLNMEFTWTRSVDFGSQEELSSDLYTNSRVFGSAVTSILTVRTEQPGSHAYTCGVTLNITLPRVRANMSERRVEVIGPAEPHVPVNIVERIISDVVTVQWQVTSLSYDPESYRVLYGISGEELNMTSRLVSSGDDIAVTELTLSVSLTGLGTGTYNYVLEVNNSFGVRQSQVRSFTIAEESTSALSSGVAAGIGVSMAIMFSIGVFIIVFLSCCLIKQRTKSSSDPTAVTESPIGVQGEHEGVNSPTQAVETLDDQAALKEKVKRLQKKISKHNEEQERVQRERAEAEQATARDREAAARDHETALRDRKAAEKASEITKQAQEELDYAREETSRARSIVTSV